MATITQLAKTQPAQDERGLSLTRTASKRVATSDLVLCWLAIPLVLLVSAGSWHIATAMLERWRFG
jgi:hypothetical protein